MEDLMNAFKQLELGPEQRLDILRQLRKLVTEEKFEKDCLKNLLPLLKNDDELVRRLTWQVLYNNSVNNTEFVQIVQENLDLCSSLAEEKVHKTQNVICAMIFLDLSNFATLEYFKTMLKLSTKCEFALLSALKLVQFEGILSKIDMIEEKLDLYDMCLDALENGKLEEKTLWSLVKCFKTRNQILMTTYAKDSICPLEETKLLLLICKASTQDRFQSLLQSDKSLLIDAVYLLRMIHETEKSNGSLHQAFETGSETEHSPVDGFKCNLIRLIGNLCYGNKSNQDEVKILIVQCYKAKKFTGTGNATCE